MGTPCRIRIAGIDDIPPIAAIERVAFSDPWPGSSFMPFVGDPCFLVATQGDRLVAYAVARAAGDEAEILNLAVTPEVRRRGLARRLLHRLVSDLTDAGVNRIYLEVRPSNAAAIALYRDAGFEVVGRRRGYYRNPPEDGLLMARSPWRAGGPKKNG